MKLRWIGQVQKGTEREAKDTISFSKVVFLQRLDGNLDGVLRSLV
jgi:hypothetical protein